MKQRQKDTTLFNVKVFSLHQFTILNYFTASTTLEDHELLYPIKFLNSLNLRDIPNHDLDLRIRVLLEC
ncbi:hypothetical protein RJ639_003055 [Escallonia herrerae]|uniref:Uncharacterized protein n=1 Tax=Escallonia herrerae TaxID=1293975 RepID=A0AA88W3H6_9ASTE|nr:hypothetical protein RJ639_003055 [Escallonia herrerae]